MLTVARALCVVVTAFSSASYAQNINQIFRNFGGIAQQAVQQAALFQWGQIPPDERICVENNLRQYGSSIEAYAAHGIFPNDTRLSPLRASCRSQAIAQSLVRPSFNCAQARAPDEFAICANPELSELDNGVAVGFQYFKQMNGDAAAKQVNTPLYQARQACGANQSCIRQKQIDAIIKYHDAGAPVAVSRWDLNGSILLLIDNRNLRKLFYESPRPEVIAAGGGPGDIVFSGELINSQYAGYAYFYSARCGRMRFQVSGLASEDLEDCRKRCRASFRSKLFCRGHRPSISGPEGDSTDSFHHPAFTREQQYYPAQSNSKAF